MKTILLINIYLLFFLVPAGYGKFSVENNTDSYPADYNACFSAATGLFKFPVGAVYSQREPDACSKNFTAALENAFALQPFFFGDLRHNVSFNFPENNFGRGINSNETSPFAENNTSGGNLVRMNTKLFQRFNSNPADGNVVVYGSQFSNAIDVDDALKLTTTGENFGMKRDGKILVVEARQPIIADDTISYYIWNLSPLIKDYKLEFSSENLVQPGLIATLEDSYTGTKTILDLTQASVSVDFSINTDPASFAFERFRLVFKKGSTVPLKFISIAANGNGRGGVKIDWKVAEEQDVVSYEVQRSIDGSVFSSAGFVKADGRGFYSWTDENPFNGNSFYRIKGIGVNGDIKLTNIAKVFAGNTKAAISVIPNPGAGNIISIRFSNMQKARYDIKLINVSGQVVYFGFLEHAGGNSIQTINLSPAVSAGIYQMVFAKANRAIDAIKVLIH